MINKGNLMLKSKIYSFSAAGDDQTWLDGYKERLGEKSFSQAVLQALQLQDTKKGKSAAEHTFDEYCRANFLDKDAMLRLLMTDLRVCNGV